MGLSSTYAQGAGVGSRVAVLTASGTWTHPDGATPNNPLPIRAYIIGGGGGGGGGAGCLSNSTGTTALASGFGGQSGEALCREFAVTGPITCVIGAGGAGGPGAATTAYTFGVTYGSAGANGGSTTLSTDPSGGAVTARGGTAGAGSPALTNGSSSSGGTQGYGNPGSAANGGNNVGTTYTYNYWLASSSGQLHSDNGKRYQALDAPIQPPGGAPSGSINRSSSWVTCPAPALAGGLLGVSLGQQAVFSSTSDVTAPDSTSWGYGVGGAAGTSAGKFATSGSVKAGAGADGAPGVVIIFY